MAVTNHLTRTLPQVATLLTCASLGMSHLANATSAPEDGYIQFKYLNYKDSQPNIDRISISAPSAIVMLPFADDWTVEGSLTSDTISGATPQYHTAKSGMVKMHDERIGKYVNLTKYFSRGTLTLGRSYSSESDYISSGYLLSATLQSEDKNTTWNFGVSRSNDQISAPTMGVANERKEVHDFIFGVTQVLSPLDIVQINMTKSNGTGYYSDPYKLFDARPTAKDATAILVRWNHHLKDNNTTLRSSYRYYEDSFDIRSYTLGLEWIVPLSNGWSIMPLARYYSQNSAFFYADPTIADFPSFPDVNQRYFSQDQRLSAFGARTLGLKVTKLITPDLLVDVKYEDYEQRSRWQISGDGSKGLEPFYAKVWQVGLTYKF